MSQLRFSEEKKQKSVEVIEAPISLAKVFEPQACQPLYAGEGCDCGQCRSLCIMDNVALAITDFAIHLPISIASRG